MHRQFRLLVGILFILALLVAGSVYGAPSGSIIYVKHDATGSNNGSSWANAYTELQDALGTAQSGDEIWVAQGVYYPAPNAIERTATFELVDGVALYGGFAGTETERHQRDWEANLTVLSGDLDRNDITDENGVATDTDNIVGRNAYHVVMADGVGETTTLDGFAVTAGLADGDDEEANGGGIYAQSCDASLVNATFSGNRADGSGGAMYNDDSSPTLDGVTFSENHAEVSGGAMTNYRSDPTLTNVIFTVNQADFGGGMLNWDSGPTLTDVRFRGNQAVAFGGGMDNSFSSPTLTNVIFSGNRAPGQGGGGMSNRGASSPTLINVTFAGNQAQRGGGIRNENSSPTVVNSILWGNSPDNIRNDDSSPTVTYSNVGWPSGVYPGLGNINQDPLFVEPISADQAPTTAGSYRLKEGSPAIDAGINDAVAVDTDLAGQPRIVDGTGNGNPIVDMGSHEFQPSFRRVYLPLVLAKH